MVNEMIFPYDYWKTRGKVADISLKKVAKCPNVLEDYEETEKKHLGSTTELFFQATRA